VDLNQEGKFGTRKINQKIHRKLLARAIIKHSLPYNFVEYEGIREWIKYINPNVDMKCRNTTVLDVEKEYIEDMEKVKQMMFRIPNRICLTSDVWTAITSEGYICLTAHFVDENWKLTSEILNFCRMKPPHTGVELESVIFYCLKQWGIDKKIFSLTLDNASANNILQDILKSHLRVHRNLLCDGEFFRVRCCAHTFNLIVQDGLKVVEKALHSIRESVKYVKSSDGRTLKFKECVSDVGINMSIGLRLDVITRWNSTYLMLESAIKYRKAFEILKVVDRNYKSCPSSEEWDRGEKMCQFLEPFYEITNMMFGSSYPTSNLYFMQIWKIQFIIEENLLNDDVTLKQMAMNMNEKFQKYWKEYNVGLAFGAILDPRLKVDFIMYCYKKLDILTYEEKTEKVLEKFKRLFKEYVMNLSIPDVSLSQSPTEYISMSQSNIKGRKLKRSRIISVSILYLVFIVFIFFLFSFNMCSL